MVIDSMNADRPTALILCFSHLNKDPRVLRQISWLRESYEVTTLGFSPSGVDDVEHIDYHEGPASSIVGKIKRAAMYFGGDYETFYWNRNRLGYVERLATRRFDLIIANDFDTLPMGVRSREEGAKLLFDAHEYSPLEFTESLRWRIMMQPMIRHICREYIPRADLATTVCRSIAETYEREYGKKFEVITNASAFEDLEPSPTDAEKIRLIYHGGVSPSRRTEGQIKMMKFLDDPYELNLMVIGQESYLDHLRRLASPMNNVKFLPPVATDEIANFTNQFDVGVYSLPPTNFNNRYALPNKFFEFVQARLAIVVGPSPEMARFVTKYDLGVVAADFTPEAMARAIDSLTPERIDHFKANAHRHAYELSADKNRERFLELIRSA